MKRTANVAFLGLLGAAFAMACTSTTPASDAPSGRSDSPDDDDSTESKGGSGKGKGKGEKDDEAETGSGTKTEAGKDGSKTGACAAGTADCDKNGSCETDTRLDAKNCGGCGAIAELPSLCVDGKILAPIDELTNMSPPMVTDALAAYWVKYDGGKYLLRSASHTTSTALTLASDLPLGAGAEKNGLGLSSTHVYISVRSSTGTTVQRVAKTGGTFTLFGQDSDGALGANQYGGVAVSDAYVFWVGNKGIYRQPLAGGASEVWAKTGGAEDLRVQAGIVYWTTYQGSVAHRPAGLPATTSSFDHWDDAFSYTLDATNLYYLQSGDIYARPLAGGAPSVRLKTSLNLGVLEVDSSRMYFSSIEADYTRTLMSAPLAGGTPTMLWRVPKNQQLWGIVRGGPKVYFNHNWNLFRLQ